jgi:hypothetical protein
MATDSLTNALFRETSHLVRRLEEWRQTCQLWLLAGAFAIVFLVTGTVFQLKPALPYGWVILVACIVLSLVYAQIVNDIYRRRGKKVLITGLTADTALHYHPQGLFTPESVAAHKILPPYDEAHIEDGFDGMLHGMPVAFQEVRLTGLEQDGDRNRRREYTRFWGLLIKIRLPRALDAHTVIIPRSSFQVFFRTAFSTFEPVRVASKFEKTYHVLGTDQIEARVILDPAFMERFLEAASIMRARWMEVSFRGDEILFAVQRFRPIFEIGSVWQPVTGESLRKVADHVDAVDRMMETLRLNRQFGF